MAKTKDKMVDAAENVKPYVERAMSDEKVRTDVMSAFATARELYNDLLEEKESLFASHPTFGERVAAVQGLAKATENDTRPALELFDNPEEVEKELTDYLTGILYHIQQLQAAAAQES